MKARDLSVTGPGVYLLPEDVRKKMDEKLCHPTELPVESVLGVFNDLKKEDIAAIIIGKGKVHNGWVGVEWTRLMKLLDVVKGEAWPDFLDIRQTIEEMIRDGILQIAAHGGWFGWFFDFLNPKIVCPTYKLVEKLHKRRLALMPA